MGLCDIVAQRHLVAARDSQLAALAPFERRELRDEWGITRVPRAGLHPPFAPRDRRDALLQAALPGTMLPRQLAGILTLFTAGAGTYVSVSPPIPFAWRLLNLTLTVPGSLFDADDRVMLRVIDTDPGTNNPAITGTPVYLPARRGAGFTDATSLGGFASNLSQDTAMSIAVPHFIELNAGRRIALFARYESIASQLWTVAWCVEELIASRQDVSALPVAKLAA